MISKPRMTVAFAAGLFTLLSGCGGGSDSAMDAANAALPGGRVSIVVLPAPGGDRPVRVRKRLPDEVHPNGLSSAYLHPSSAAVLRLERWDRGGPGLLGYQYLYPLHAGRLAGPAHAVAVGITGSALFLLGASGLWLWWRRGRRFA